MTHKTDAELLGNSIKLSISENRYLRLPQAIKDDMHSYGCQFVDGKVKVTVPFELCQKWAKLLPVPRVRP